MAASGDLAFSTQPLMPGSRPRSAPLARQSYHKPQYEYSPPSPRTDERSPIGRASWLNPPPAHHNHRGVAEFGASAYGGGKASVQVATKAKSRGNSSLLSQRVQQAVSAGGDPHEAGRRAGRTEADLALKV